MSVDATVPRSRRALLGAAIGAAVATVASALGRPAAVRAGTDGDVVLGQLNMADSTTSIRSNTADALSAVAGGNGQTALHAQAWGAGGHGVYGWGSNPSGASVGVWGVSDAEEGWGVKGENTTLGTGVYGTAPLVGVHGQATNPTDAYAPCWGVLGTTAGVGSSAAGVRGRVDNTEGVASGVEGISFAPGSSGVFGSSAVGTGVRGVSVSGIGGSFSSTTGRALAVDGKATFSRSGRATVLAGRSYVDVSPKGTLTGTPLCFANLTSYRAGTYVIAVRPNYPSTGKVRIYLNKAVTASTYVAWLVLG